jgi:hypothetical protein
MALSACLHRGAEGLLAGCLQLLADPGQAWHGCPLGSAFCALCMPYMYAILLKEPLAHLLVMYLDDKICMMTTRLACNRAIESSYWRMDNNSDVGLLTGYVLYRLPIELEFMDLDTFSR